MNLDRTLSSSLLTPGVEGYRSTIRVGYREVILGARFCVVRPHFFRTECRPSEICYLVIFRSVFTGTGVF